MAGSSNPMVAGAQTAFGALFAHQFSKRSRRAAKLAYQQRIAALGKAKGVIQEGKTSTTSYLNKGYDTARSDVNTGYEKAVEGFKSYQAAGKVGLSTLETLLSNPDSVINTSAYKWALGQGLESLDRAQGSRGKRFSGQAMKEITDYGQGAASQQYQNVFSNASSMANIGANATSAVGQLYGQQAGTLANLETSRGKDLASNEYNFTQDLANIELGYGGVGGQYASDRMQINQQFTDYRYKTLDYMSNAGGMGGGSGGGGGG